MIKRYISGMLRGRRGFTLIELVVVIAIIGILAAIVVPTVSGVTGSAKEGRKESDLKNVSDQVVKYEVDNSALPITESSDPTVAVRDADDDGTIVVKVDTDATDPTDFTGLTADVTCGDGTDTTVAAALDNCFGSVDFTVLVPDYLKTEPAHATDDVTVASLSTGADLSVTGVNAAGDTLELWLDVTIGAGDLKAWNVDTNNDALILISDDSY